MKTHIHNTVSSLALVIIVSLIYSGCGTSEPPGTRPKDTIQLPVIPAPASVAPSSGPFAISSGTTLVVAGSDTGFQGVGTFAAELLGIRYFVDLLSSSSANDSNVIVLRKNDAIQHPEGYRMNVSPRAIVVEAATPAGAFYALQTLLQLLPQTAFTSLKSGSWNATIPAVMIDDSPRYSYRGMHLDVGRHFFPVSFIKRYIDLLVMYKMNRFHWHLTEDQGWRIEIKRYPKLASVGGFRDSTLIGHHRDLPRRYDKTRYGGYYTQDEVREVVAYATKRFVTIIPEIEMPGHAMAALHAYPELSCTYGPIPVSPDWGIFKDVFCSKDSVFTFLEGVLDEVLELFPSTYIHIGADEVPKDRWEVCPNCIAVRQREKLKDTHHQQSYFVQRIEKYLNAKGRRLIGWDEILEGGLAPNATVMSWRGEVGGIAAARQHHDVVMTPTSHCYFDYYQGQGEDEPISIGGFVSVRKVYDYEPTPEELEPEFHKYIMGAQGNVWTEYIPNEDHVEYMVLPRMPALAEVLWSPASLRDFDSFADRVAGSTWRWDYLGYDYATHILDADYEILPADAGIRLRMSTRDKQAVIRYTTDGSEPVNTSPEYRMEIPLAKTTSVRAATFRNGERSKRSLRYDFTMHKAVGKPIGLDALPHPTYGFRGRQALINGTFGSDTRFSDGEWLGWSRWPVDAVIDFGTETRIDTVGVRMFNSVPEWIWLPRSVEVSGSENGRDFTPVASFDAFNYESAQKVVRVALNTKGITTRYLKVKIQNYGVIPAGKSGAGNYTWLFVDEIEVK